MSVFSRDFDGAHRQLVPQQLLDVYDRDTGHVHRHAPPLTHHHHPAHHAKAHHLQAHHPEAHAQAHAVHHAPSPESADHPGGHPSGGPESDGASHGDSDFAHLLGHLPDFGGGIAIIPIDHLTINNTTLIENHLTENNSIVFNAAPGGTVDVGGDVSALSAQQLDVHSVSASHAAGSELGWSDAAWGEAGGFEAVLFGHMPGLGGTGPGPLVIMPIDHLTINNTTLIQNFETQNTNVVFNAAAGGTVDVGGDVSALSSQVGDISHQPHDPSFIA
jgi:hypothetical protein